MVECTCLLHIVPLSSANFRTSIRSWLVVQVVSAVLRGNWQDFAHQPNFARQLPGGRGNIFDMTSKLVEGFRRVGMRKLASPVDFSIGF